MIDNQQFQEEIIRLRRDFHKHPEVSFHERRTSSVISAYLKELGLEVKENVYGYGLYADLKGKNNGPMVALRADMDALPIMEESDLPFASIESNVMHACGHDGHMAALMGAAKQLTKMREQLAGTVRFIFQPAEEMVPGGAKGMIEAGVLDDVQYIFGLHLWSEFPLGTFWTTNGAMMAASDHFKIKVQGKGGHGANPHTAIDAIVIASHIVMASQHIISRQVDPIESGVLSFGIMQAGSVFNAIANTAILEGTVRSFAPEVRDSIQSKLEKTAMNIADIYGATVEFTYDRGYPPLINHPQESGQFLKVANQIFGEANCGIMNPNMAGEDFAYYLEKIPGAFCFVGAGSSSHYPHHHPKFNFDENVLPSTVELICNIALHYIGEKS